MINIDISFNTSNNTKMPLLIIFRDQDDMSKIVDIAQCAITEDSITTVSISDIIYNNFGAKPSKTITINGRQQRGRSSFVRQVTVAAKQFIDQK